MFRLHKITISDFRSYRGTHEFEFPLTSGLYYFTGHNSVDKLGANGAGKSTFLDAIVWCLYGRTARGLKATDVLPWGSTEQAVVALDLTVGERFEVRRTQRPNSLTLNGRPLDQTELEKQIRLNFESFLHTVIKPQFGIPFFNLTPTAKLALFSDIMGLEFWLTKSDEAAVRAKKLNDELIEINNLKTTRDGQLDLFNKDIAELSRKMHAFTDDIEAEVENLKEDMGALATKKHLLCEELSALIHGKVEQEGKIGLCMQKLQRWERARDLEMDNLSKDRAYLLDCQSDKDKTEKAFKALGSLEGRCPCCGQQIEPKHIEYHKSAHSEKLISLTEMIKDLNIAVKEDIEAIALKRTEIGLATMDLQAAKDELNDIKSTIKEKRLLDKTIDAQKAALEAAISKKSRQKNPYKELIELKKSALKRTKDELLDLKEELKLVSAEHAATEFWIKGFRRIRLFIIEQTFQTLEVEINNALAQLGMIDWQITLDVEKENKSGGMTKGFMVFVQSPSNKEPVRWENWSGGETQRLQLAGDLGLSNLIMQQAGLHNRVEFYDEPSTHLSPEGMIDLANMLHDRAITEQKIIWIVDHASVSSFGDFQGIITVRKDKNGSKIENLDA